MPSLPKWTVGYSRASARWASTGRHPSRYRSAASSSVRRIRSMWLWMIAAPASMHASASAAISSGVIGTLGLRALVVTPLMAASMITGPMASDQDAFVGCSDPDDGQRAPQPQEHPAADREVGHLVVGERAAESRPELLVH